MRRKFIALLITTLLFTSAFAINTFACEGCIEHEINNDISPRYVTCDGGNLHMTNYTFELRFYYWPDGDRSLYEVRTCVYCGVSTEIFIAYFPA